MRYLNGTLICAGFAALCFACTRLAAQYRPPPVLRSFDKNVSSAGQAVLDAARRRARSRLEKLSKRLRSEAATGRNVLLYADAIASACLDEKLKDRVAALNDAVLVPQLLPLRGDEKFVAALEKAQLHRWDVDPARQRRRLAQLHLGAAWLRRRAWDFELQTVLKWLAEHCGSSADGRTVRAWMEEKRRALAIERRWSVAPFESALADRSRILDPVEPSTQSIDDARRAVYEFARLTAAPRDSTLRELDEIAQDLLSGYEAAQRRLVISVVRQTRRLTSKKDVVDVLAQRAALAIRSRSGRAVEGLWRVARRQFPQRPWFLSKLARDLVSVYRRSGRLPEAEHLLERIVSEEAKAPKYRFEGQMLASVLRRPDMVMPATAWPDSFMRALAAGYSLMQAVSYTPIPAAANDYVSVLVARKRADRALEYLTECLRSTTLGAPAWEAILPVSSTAAADVRRVLDLMLRLPGVDPDLVLANVELSRAQPLFRLQQRSVLLETIDDKSDFSGAIIQLSKSFESVLKAAEKGGNPRWEQMAKELTGLSVFETTVGPRVKQIRRSQQAARLSAGFDAMPPDHALVTSASYSTEDGRQRCAIFVSRRGATTARFDVDLDGVQATHVSAWRQALESRAAVRGEPLAARPELRDDSSRSRLSHMLRAVLASIVEVKPSVLWVNPDGLLATIPWGLLVHDGKPLREITRVRYCHSFASLQDRRPSPREPSLLLVGDVDYGTGRAGGGSSARVWKQLPGTLAEIGVVGKVFSERFSTKPMRLRRRDATRRYFCGLAPKGRFIHVATHGDAVTAFDGLEPLLGGMVGDPGLAAWNSSAIVLSGANHDDAAKRRVAFLRGARLATLDLSECELAVLSACKTGIGPLHHSRTVASLREALHSAGARHTITSLWTVSDAGSHAFFAEFYKNLWRARMPVATAFREAQQATKKLGWGPGVWAGFVLYSSGA